MHARRADSQKLPAELTDAELLTTVLGPSTALSCEWLTTTHDGLRAIALLSPTELIDHGFKGGAVDKLGAVFEIARRYGECEWKIGEPFRAPATSTRTSASTWPQKSASTSTRCCSTTSTASSATSS